tara:strand:- start:1005 stop:3329 length:2325 start_codon:yes stop_codon:yes gene_type:complete
MPTGKQISYNNFMLLMNFADTEFNRIYSSMLAAERLNPGAATALLQDIRAQEISIREERKDLSRIFAEGVKADADALATIQKAQNDLAIAEGRVAADIAVQGSRAAISKQEILADLRTSFRTETEKGTQSGSQGANKLAERPTEQTKILSTPTRSDSLNPADRRAAEQQIERRANELLNDVFVPGLDQASNASERKAFLEASKQQIVRGLQTYTSVGTYKTILGDDLVSSIDKAVDRVAKPRMATIDSEIKDSEKAQKEILDSVGSMGPNPNAAEIDSILRPAIQNKAIILGIDPEQAEVILARVGKAPSKRSELVLQAAVNARQLPSLMDTEIAQADIEGERYDYVAGLNIKQDLAAFNTAEELDAAIEAGDEAAIGLYNRVLGFQPAQIKLLQEGDYPRRLYENELDAIKLSIERRQAKRKLQEGQDIDTVELHRKAMQVWQDLYGPKRPKMDVRRTAQRIRENYELDQVPELLRGIAKEDGFNPRQIRKLDATIRRMERAETAAELTALRKDANKVRMGGLSEIKFDVQGTEYTLPQLKQEIDKQAASGAFTDDRQKAAFDQSYSILERAIEEGTFDKRMKRQVQKTFDFMAEDVLREKPEAPAPAPATQPGLPIQMPAESVIDEQAAVEVSDEEAALIAAFGEGMSTMTNDPNGVGSVARPATFNKIGKGILSQTNVATAGRTDLKTKKEVARGIAEKTLEEMNVTPQTLDRAKKYQNQYATLYRLTEDQSKISMDDLSKIDPMVNKDVELATAVSLFGTVDSAFPDDLS